MRLHSIRWKPNATASLRREVGSKLVQRGAIIIRAGKGMFDIRWQQ